MLTLQNINIVLKSRRIRWVGHVEHMGTGNDAECEFDTVVGGGHFRPLDVGGG